MTAQAILSLGDRMPEFTLDDDAGVPRSSADFAGSWLLLWWYPKADTPGCTAEGIAFTEHASEFDELGCRVAGISFDVPADNAAFRAKHGFPFMLLSDPERELGAAFGVIRDSDDQYADYPRRKSFLFDASGVLRRVYDVENPADHPDDVLDDLGELMP